jgi:Tfp pilus assembly protein PilF
MVAERRRTEAGGVVAPSSDQDDLRSAPRTGTDHADRAEGAGQPRRMKYADAFRAAAKLHGEGRTREAIGLYERLLRSNPRDASVWNNLGVALRVEKRFSAALACYHRALEIDPDGGGAWGNIGNVLKDLGRFGDAIAAHMQALHRDPTNAGAVHNCGITLKESGDIEGAREMFQRAAKLDPEHAGVRWDLALAELQLGDFESGWRGYEVRWNLEESPRRPYRQPAWRGEDIAGSTILVYPEQGFGDTMLATRFLLFVKARAAELVLEVKPELRRLFDGLPGVDRFVEHGADPGHFDVHCAMMGLPGIYGATTDNLPALPRFNVPPAAHEAVAPLFARAGERFRVGIIWSGSLTFKGNAQRRASLGDFLALAEVPGVELYSLQKGPLEKDIADYGAGALLTDVGGRVRDFAETAAALEALDLVVMTDSSVAHLAGILGVPVWNLLNLVPYWLYMTEREDTPWYPSMRLFRQRAYGEWEPVFARVRRALGDAVEAKRRGAWPPKPQAAG